MKFSEIPAKCSVCGKKLVDGEGADQKMMFYYLKCPVCGEISNVMCVVCSAVLYDFSSISSVDDFLNAPTPSATVVCECCGSPIEWDKGKVEVELRGHQCDIHIKNSEKAETL